MDARTTMIVAKGKPVTFNVANCAYNHTSGKWDITYNNGKTYSYNPQSITFLKDPVSLNPKSYRVWRNGELFDNITAILVFKDVSTEYWQICFSTGYAHDYRRDELQIEPSVLDTVSTKQVFEYLRETADYVSVHTEDGTAILSKQYEKIEYMSEKSAAAVYLCPESYAAGTDLDASAPIFPFGCNESQFQAVRNALANRISVIEGPPGTGKTQTILNIIANLVIQGKSLQIVSNNNSAIDNIIEKLASPQYQMDFIVARLGSNAHKNGTKQAERDKLKDHILEEYGLPLLRFSTNGSEEKQKLSAKLDELLNIG